MKLAIITDTHFGVRNSNKALMLKQEEFYENVFFPYLKENNISTLLHLGDLFDKRKSVEFTTLEFTNRVLMDRLNEMCIECHFIAGNHDCAFKSTNSVNSLKELYAPHYKNMHFYWEEPVELQFDKCKIMLCPWIAPDNEEVSLKAISETNAQVLMGHFEIVGYLMGKGQLCDHGLDASLFSKFHSVYSGHFHTKSSGKNITYLGAPYQMTWNDYGDKKGFHIFDTETFEMEFIQNPYQSFHKVKYEDSDLTFDQVASLDFSQLTNAFVKVIIINKTNSYLFDRFVDRITSVGPADVKIVDDNHHIDALDVETLIDETKTTAEILQSYIESLEINVDKNKLNQLLQNIYKEATLL